MGKVLSAIEKRDKIRSQNMKNIIENKEHYLTLKLHENHRNELKHKQRIGTTKRKQRNRKEHLIDNILKKNEK